MKINQKKLDRQNKSLSLWFTLTNACGILEAVTGFGKTYVAILAILRMNKKFPDFTTIVVVPSTKLKEDWTGYWSIVEGKKEWVPGHIEKHNLLNVSVYVINTYVKYIWDCDLLIADECHNYANEDSIYFSKMLKITNRTYFLGLTATLSKKEKAFFSSNNIEVFDTVTEEEAEREGYTARSITYNLGITQTEEDREYYAELHRKFNAAFSKFEHNFSLALACGVGNNKRFKVENWQGNKNVWKTGKEWREAYARYQRWDGKPDHYWSPTNIAKYASMFSRAMRERKDYLYNLPSKLHTAAYVVNFLKDKKIITFAETTSFSDKLAQIIGKEARSYHVNLKTVITSKDEIVAVAVKSQSGTTKFKDKNGNVFEWEEIKKLYPDAKKIGKTKRMKEALSLFENGQIRVLCTAKALDEGMDIEDIDCALICSYSGSRRQDVQRGGRSKRIDRNNKNKKAIIINLYVKGTQEEKWLRSKQQGRRKAIYVDTIEDINFNPQAVTL